MQVSIKDDYIYMSVAHQHHSLTTITTSKCQQKDITLAKLLKERVLSSSSSKTTTRSFTSLYQSLITLHMFISENITMICRQNLGYACLRNAGMTLWVLYKTPPTHSSFLRVTSNVGRQRTVH